MARVEDELAAMEGGAQVDVVEEEGVEILEQTTLGHAAGRGRRAVMSARRGARLFHGGGGVELRNHRLGRHRFHIAQQQGESLLPRVARELAHLMREAIGAHPTQSWLFSGGREWAASWLTLSRQ